MKDPEDAHKPLRVLELYCGIGGCTASLGSAASVVAAVDINRDALAVYRHNYPHPTRPATIESLPAASIDQWSADLWWMSPPCQPFTRRGLGRDADDPRTQSLLELIRRLKSSPPTYLALENVPGFCDSSTHDLLRTTLDRLDYEVRDQTLCPTSLGVPNRRRRFYLVAGRQPLQALQPLPDATENSLPLRDFLDPTPDPDLWAEPTLVDHYRHALNVVEPEDPEAVAACFTSAYGHSPVRSGSYLRTPTGLRRFSPTEILRLLGFPPSFTLPPDLPRPTAWRLVGNSLSVPAVRHVLSAIPELGHLSLDQTA
ncbi:MAG: DNA cytosine methyltransferase [Thermoanaerobaculia bacterium]